MKTLIQYINEGILGDIDDTLNAADENTDRYLIANWLNENTDFVSMFANRVSDFTASSKMRINSKNELDVYEFRPINTYASSTKTSLDLPVPDYIKFNSASTIDMVADSIDEVKLNKMPHFNRCDTLFLRSWNVLCEPTLAQLDIDELYTLFIDFENIRPASWPKTKVNNTFMYVNTIRDYSIDYVKSRYLDYDIEDFKGLNTNTLIIPDYFITNSAIKFGYNGNDIVIDDSNPYELEMLNKLFVTKSFKALYVYDATSIHVEKCYRVKKHKNTYVISSKTGRNINKMIYNV